MGATPSTWNFGSKWLHWSEIADYRFFAHSASAVTPSVKSSIKGELNPETNIGLNEYLREIKFCTGQESVDVVQRKKIFNDKNHYLFTYFKKCVLLEDGSSYRPYYTFIYATSAFTKTLLSERRGTNV